MIGALQKLQTSSAMLCRIFRWTDAFTWFCADISSKENLHKKRKEKKIYLVISVGTTTTQGHKLNRSQMLLAVCERSYREKVMH